MIALVGHFAGESMLRRVRALVIVAATAALAAVATPAHGSPTACGLAAAKKAVTATKLRMKLLGPDAVVISPSSVDGVICHDFTRDGRTDIAVTIASGGTAGDVGFAVFRSVADGWQVALARNGYKVGLFRIGNDLAGSLPVYKNNDPNCCPTGGFDHQRFHWNGKRFVVVRNWHTKAFHP
jgi:hypothetical protein